MLKKKEKNIATIRSDCCRCPLHEEANTVCLAGRGAINAALMLFVDYPDSISDKAGRPFKLATGELLDWMFQRMSIDPAKIRYEYTLRCYPKNKKLISTKDKRDICFRGCNQYRYKVLKKIKPKAVVVMGNISLEAFTGRVKISEVQGLKIECNEPAVKEVIKEVWCAASPYQLLQVPSDTPNVYRVLFQAAKEAGLKPKINPEVKPYRWEII